MTSIVTMSLANKKHSVAGKRKHDGSQLQPKRVRFAAKVSVKDMSTGKESQKDMATLAKTNLLNHLFAAAKDHRLDGNFVLYHACKSIQGDITILQALRETLKIVLTARETLMFTGKLWIGATLFKKTPRLEMTYGVFSMGYGPQELTAVINILQRLTPSSI